MREDILGIDLGGSSMEMLVYHDGRLIREKHPTGPECNS